MMKMALFDKLENMLEFDVPKTLLDREISILEKQATEVEDKELEEKLLLFIYLVFIYIQFDL